MSASLNNDVDVRGDSLFSVDINTADHSQILKKENENNLKNDKKDGKRKLTVIPLVAITYFCVAGGPFGLESLIASAPPVFSIGGLIIFPWFWSLPLALVCAELAGMMPTQGGLIDWITKTYGRFFGCVFGFATSVVSILDDSLYPALCVDYLMDAIHYIFPQVLPYYHEHKLLIRWGIGMIAIIGIMILNLMGVEILGWTSVIFTIIIVIPFLILAAMSVKDITNAKVWLIYSGKIDVSYFLTLLIWNNSGWTVAGFLAGDCKNPARTFPIGMILTIIVISFLYVFPAMVSLCIYPNWSTWVNGDFTVIAGIVGGKFLMILMTISSMFSNLGLFSAGLGTSSKGIAYMAVPARMIPKFMAWSPPSIKGCIKAIKDRKERKNKKKLQTEDSPILDSTNVKNNQENNNNNNNSNNANDSIYPKVNDGSGSYDENSPLNTNNSLQTITPISTESKGNNKNKNKKESNDEEEEGNPALSIILSCTCTAILTAISGFEQIVKAEICVNSVIIMFILFTLVFLRIKKPKEPRPYRAFGKIPTFFVAIFLLIPISIAIFEIVATDLITKLLGLGVFAIAILGYIVFCFWEVIAFFKSIFQFCRNKLRKNDKKNVAAQVSSGSNKKNDFENEDQNNYDDNNDQNTNEKFGLLNSQQANLD